MVRDPDALRSRSRAISRRRYDLGAGTWERPEGPASTPTGRAAALAGLPAALEQTPEWRFERAAERRRAAASCSRAHVEVVTEPGHATLVSLGPKDPTGARREAGEHGVIVRDLPGPARARLVRLVDERGPFERLVAAI